MKNKTIEIKRAYTRETLQLFFAHFKRYPFRLVAAVLTITLASLASMFSNVMIGRQIDYFTQINPQVFDALNLILKSILLVVAVRVGASFVWRISGFLASTVVPRLRMDAENEAFKNLNKKSVAFFTDEFTGSLVRRVRSYGQSLGDFVEIIFWRFIPLFVEIFFLFVVFLLLSPALAALYSVWIVMMAIVNVWYGKKKSALRLGRAERDSKLTAILADVIGSMTNVMLFNGLERERKTFSEANENRRIFSAKAWRSNEMAGVMTNILNGVMELVAMGFLGYLWTKGTVGIGIFASAQLYLVRIFRSIDDMSSTLRRVYEIFADADEMTQIMLKPATVCDTKSAKSLTVKKGEILFKNIRFAYQTSDEILPAFSLKIPARQKTALVGPSGAGKTTIIKLLLRFYDVDKGNILIDGQDIAKVTQHSLRDAMSMVPQEPALFHRSLFENIAYGKPGASLEDVVEASKKAHCHEFISKLSQGYDTFVGERGVKLSGGERQRVAIARAILKDAPILLLDEATSALDSESEHLIQDALHTLMKDKTVVVIAHRLSTIMDMDRIIVMENGQITNQGTHAELTKKGGKYQDLWHIQAGGFSR
ncbi:ABC transporter ATP-binding protein [Candidatus Uhrbacteria bacterium]|nr:ABC transporter ATP-binding protein [Candidatus Uhrbacteria bacterium]